MKNIFLTVLFLVVFTGISYAKIKVPMTAEKRVDVVDRVVDTVIIRYFSNTATVIMRYTDTNGEYVREEKVYFLNKEDDPDTIIDEATTDFDDFLSKSIDSQALLKQVEAKLQ